MLQISLPVFRTFRRMVCNSVPYASAMACSSASSSSVPSQ